jgi:hypothetical protein
LLFKSNGKEKEGTMSILKKLHTLLPIPEEQFKSRQGFS